MILHSPDLLPIITIDGPSGVGKSTIAGLLAEKLDIPHLDTGAMFRQVALVLGDNGANLPSEEIKDKLSSLEFDLAGTGSSARLYCNGKEIGDEIRTEKVAMLASKIAQKQEVRDFLLQSERKIGARHSLIADGRDTGTIVFPKAAFKIFLDATPLSRACRRQHDLEKLGLRPDLASLEKEMSNRDMRERNRPLAPLRPAEDAIIIDSSNLSISDVLEKIMAYIRQRSGDTGTEKK